MNISDFHIPSSHKEKYFNPYSHFARDTNTDRFTLIDEHGHGDEKKKHKEDIHEYKICEIRPPSIEKVLNIDFYCDISNVHIFLLILQGRNKSNHNNYVSVPQLKWIHVGRFSSSPDLAR